MKVHNLLLLLHLPAKHIKGKKPLINFFQSHVMTSSEYLNILRRNTMEKLIAKEIRVGKRKEKGDK
jgi:hypothetical protein